MLYQEKTIHWKYEMTTKGSYGFGLLEPMCVIFKQQLFGFIKRSAIFGG